MSVSPAQLIRALGQSARLLGCVDTHRELLELEDSASLDDVLGLLDELSDAIERQRPRPVGELPTRDLVVDQVLELVAAGMHDPQIAERVGLTAAQVRGIRRRAGLPGRPRGAQPRMDWETVIREAHSRGLTTPEIAAETGYTVRTIQEYLWRLGLRANRRS